MEDVWWFSVRTAQETIFRLKRRGVLTIGDLKRAEGGKFSYSFEDLMGGLDNNKTIIGKVRSLLKMLEGSLRECLMEEGDAGKGLEKWGSSVSGGESIEGSLVNNSIADSVNNRFRPMTR